MADAPDLEPMPDDWRRALVIVAHPHDVEHEAAAAVAEWTAAGRDVRYVLATRGEAGLASLTPAASAPVRTAEQRAAAAVAGVERVEFLDHPDGVVQQGPALRRDLAAAVRRHRPELLLTLNHHDTRRGTVWNTPDHRAVGRGALDAAADAANPWILPEIAEGGGPRPWNGVRWVAVAGSPYPTHAVAVGEEAHRRAIDALAEHRAHLTGLGGDRDPLARARDVVTATLESGGRRFGGRPAVAFELFTR